MKFLNMVLLTLSICAIGSLSANQKKVSQRRMSAEHVVENNIENATQMLKKHLNQMKEYRNFKAIPGTKDIHLSKVEKEKIDDAIYRFEQAIEELNSDQ